MRGPRANQFIYRQSPGGGHTFCGNTMTELIRETIRSHLNMPKPDAVLNIETHLFNVTLITPNAAEYDLDVGRNLWLNKQRWSRLIKEYVSFEALDLFCNQCGDILNGEARLGATANMMFRDPVRHPKKHFWGGCLMGATFRGDNKKAGPATLTFYSRTTYMGYMGLLDAAIAAVLARQFAPGPIAFRWHISSMQLHCFKTLPYVYSQLDLMGALKHFDCNRGEINNAKPTWKHMAKWYCKVVDHWDASNHNPERFLSSEKYGPFRRIKRRWLESQKLVTKGAPPSLHVAELDFGKAV